MSRRTWSVAIATAALAVPLVATSTAAHAAPAAPTVRTIRACSDHVARGVAHCDALVKADATGLRPAVSPAATPSGYGPSDLASAYKLTTTGGAGRTVAIVDAYDDPSAASNLATYRAQYGLPAVNSGSGPTFKKVSQTGSTTKLPAGNSGWGEEISLDVDMASAICPHCNILLVEAKSASLANLGTAVNYAASVSGVVAISNSYGGSDQSASSAYNHPGKAITASTGDDAYGVSYPASDPHVTAVGGTTLSRASNSRGWTETAWADAGSGCSSYNAKPSFQNGVNTGCSRRAVADVSADANPSTGVAVYDTYRESGWLVFGGTSVSSPIIASVYALAGGNYTNAYPYSHTGSLFDVTSGSNGSCSPAVLCTAGPGWDGPTGLGTPNGTGAF